MNPMPSIEYDGRTYKLKSRKTEIPDFKDMEDLEILVWLNRFTRPRGYSKETNPLFGLGNAVSVSQ